MRASTQQANDEVADHDAEISMILAMGFTAQKARKALEATGGDIDHAIDYLLLGGQSFSQATDNMQPVTDISMEAADNPNEPDASLYSDAAVETARRQDCEKKTSRIHMTDDTQNNIPGQTPGHFKAASYEQRVSPDAVAVGTARRHESEKKTSRIHMTDDTQNTPGQTPGHFKAASYERRVSPDAVAVGTARRQECGRTSRIRQYDVMDDMIDKPSTVTRNLFVDDNDNEKQQMKMAYRPPDKVAWPEEPRISPEASVPSTDESQALPSPSFAMMAIMDNQAHSREQALLNKAGFCPSMPDHQHAGTTGMEEYGLYLQPEPIRPGAVAVVGVGDDRTLTDDTLIIGDGKGTASVDTDNSGLPISAVVIHDREQDYEMLEEQLREKDEQLKKVLAERENVAVAQVIEQDEESQRGNEDFSGDESMTFRQKNCCVCGKTVRRISVACLLILIAIMVGLGMTVYIFIDQGRFKKWF